MEGTSYKTFSTLSLEKGNENCLRNAKKFLLIIFLSVDLERERMDEKANQVTWDLEDRR